jgi:ADP-L-glycero-D-manno-heptose 6-epimerase
MIVVTGAYGFIGSCLIGFLNEKGIKDIIAVDDFSKTEKEPNLVGKQMAQRIEREAFIQWFNENTLSVSFVFHIGARTDTTEFDYSIHEKLNVQYSKDVFNICEKQSIPLVYASSAATYGNGELGYDDHDPSVSFELQPLNPYGISKNEFDKWVIRRQAIGDSQQLKTQNSIPSTRDKTQNLHWFGLKFFNVYGPNEYHKGRMASTIFHFFNQINAKGEVNLFKSHRPDYADGEQMRDFVYVKDVLKVLWFLYQNYETVQSGLYNLGTGKARPFNDLVKNVFKNVDKPLKINYIPTPEDIRDKYQYFTEANMNKLFTEGYDERFYSLEEGIEDYVQNYLKPNLYY